MEVVLTNTIEKSKRLHLKEVSQIIVNKPSEVTTSRPDTPYVITLNGIQVHFLYDPKHKKVYAEYVDDKAMKKQQEEHEKLSQEWKDNYEGTEEEQQAKYNERQKENLQLVDYIERHEWLITYGEDHTPLHEEIDRCLQMIV